jgi:hypothetical protein
MSKESSTERIRAFLEEWMEAIDPVTPDMNREQLIACCVEAGIPQAEVDRLVDDLLRERAEQKRIERISTPQREERRREMRAWGLEPEDATRLVDEVFAEFEVDGAKS